MSIVITEMTHGQRIQADTEIEIIEKAEWERMKSALVELERQLKGTMDLIRNANKYGMIRDDKSLDYGKFIIYDSVNKGMSLSDTKKRVYESEPGRDERAVTREYNRYTVRCGVGTGWDIQRIMDYLKSKGSAIELSIVTRYAAQ